MAHFYASIQGNRSEATRMGSKKSEIYGHVRGWKSGFKIYCYADGDKDICEVYATAGSGYGNNKTVTGLVMRSVDGRLGYLAKKKDFNK